jgi:hypothetical protein
MIKCTHCESANTKAEIVKIKDGTYPIRIMCNDCQNTHFPLVTIECLAAVDDNLKKEKGSKEEAQEIIINALS